jgi:hypothetical protein
MFIKPKISLQQANTILHTKQIPHTLMYKLLPPQKPSSPEKVELLYLPFYLFDVLVEKIEKGQSKTLQNNQRVSLSVDGLLGHVVLYADTNLNFEKERKTAVPACNFEISASEAAKKALDQYKGILLEHGMRTRRSSNAKEISEGQKIYYPFWIGYYQKRHGYDFKAVDAVSGEIQGMRMRRIFVRMLKKL